ncbi:aryl-alcohol dehydrogenase (NADP+) [Conyzicola lurida]|uniref:Aryl-alcohol dehydrogenase (NADP+) n=1 Tax=Conyzicola lurida TaxID=1172621 RepID=A0A841AL10_9MICO|nr:aldo/keto reductase [Conyzicola lurida]MBB5844640.1 aryl-alcohol dehydrogenase (NADP+) [Conyzicola lurida]
MDYVKLGSTGLDVSPIALGAMSYGDPERGAHAWSLPEEESRGFLRRSVEAGINFFDTANVYSDGSSEEILGRALREFANRDETVVATKVFSQMGTGPNQRGLSRKAILQEIDNSLRRLDMEYVDLYIIHRFDPHTPLEETLEALNDVVRSGKARYLGASSMAAWQFAKALHTQREHGWARFVSMQSQYNLISREDERELFPLSLDEGIGLTPWSPLARGRLTRDWDATTARSGTDEFGKTLYRQSEDSDRAIAAAVAEIAAERGVPRAQVALAWVSAKPGVTAPIVGATKPGHLDDALASLEITLTADEIARLEAPYTPRMPEGF